ncbi:MAG: glutathione S-transferase family protein, partial [Gammaproteobacteria bacterium]|nr:glutathione S-transferase family protein [Gammaproteobacteria bacterium]
LLWCHRTRASRAVWLLEEAGVPYDRVYIDVRDAAAKEDPAFRAASPMGKVPALEDGEVRMADSAAIALYIADRYPAAGLAPAIDDPERGRYLYWMTYTPGVIEPAMTEKFGGWEANRGQHGWGDFDAMIETWEKALVPGPWLLGDRFSAADIMVGSSAVFLRMFEILPDSPVLNDYADRCLARPAYQRAMSLEQAPTD